MKYLVGGALICIAGWAFVRAVAMAKARRGLDQLARQREAGVR